MEKLDPMENQKRYRRLPSVDKILHMMEIDALVKVYGLELVTHSIRRTLDLERNRIAAGKQSAADFPREVKKLVLKIAAPSLRPVINATGVILHTNLGRAPLGESVLSEIAPIISGYCNVEFDLVKGERGHRVDHLRELLVYLTGAQDVLAVNNNAAAIVLILSTFAKRKEVVVSRGELIEIGGAFRIPDIMKSSGAKMIEVGTTNRTRLSDYENAITSRTALLFKAHTSNYTIWGFTEEVSVRELSRLAHERNIPFVYDIGSGLLRRPARLPMESEPDAAQALRDGADMVTFSGDKLLGGPQAGIVAGRRDLIEKLAKAPLMRALRVGKLTLAALSSACRGYLSDESLAQNNPLFGMLERSPEYLHALAAKLQDQLNKSGIQSEIVESAGQCGGGTLPGLVIRSFAVSLVPPSQNVKQREAFAEKMYHGLLEGKQAVVGVLREGRLVFDVLTISERDFPAICEAVAMRLQ